MNFHAYGDMWIIPFNYLEDKEEIPSRYKKKFVDFYKNFKGEIYEIAPSAEYGYAI